MAPSLLSILIPVYNEEKSVRTLVERVLSVPLPLEREILLIDDGSRDGSGRILELLAQQDHRVRVFSNPGNRGKGYSVRRGIEEARGDLILIQDADLEYDPQEYPLLLEPLLKSEADV
ncbi:MAG TPA: glycosyltransferase family 2 protein, partial [Candidatus Aminicenantes bacterium]|nr:glycosyltransferase family 2 protein [Candidatus Aminicenantes bacterium]